MKKRQVYSVLVLLLDDEGEQHNSLQKSLTRSLISGKRSEAAFFTIFQELMKEDSDELKGLL